MLLSTNLADAMEGTDSKSAVYDFISGNTTLLNCVLLLLTVLVLYLLYEINKSPSRAPPTIWGLPLIGNLLQLGPAPHLGLTKIGKNLGEVFSLRLGSWDVLVINSLNAAKDAFVENSAHFSSRPPFDSLRLGGAHLYSVSFGDYNPLQIQRKKALLKVFHQAILTNPDHLNHILLLETARMKKRLQETQASLFDPRETLKLVVSRLVFRLTFGGPVGEEEENGLTNLFEQARKFQKEANIGILADFMPWLRFALKGPVSKMVNTVAVLVGFVRKSYRQRKENYKSEDAEFCVARAITAYVASERRQLAKKTKGKSSRLTTLGEETARQGGKVDASLGKEEERPEDLERREEEEEEDEDDAIENQVVTMLSPDVIGAGTENIASTFSWALAFISSYEELQRDLHDEIDTVIGKNREPRIQDKQRMPLMQATILETLRLSSAVPMGLPHYCIEDSVVKGYTVAKGTIVLTNIWGINHDDRHFSHPYCFEPYRFLDASGNLRGDRCSLAMTFNIGPRSCAGNAVTKTVLFFLIASVLQKFEVRSTEDLTTLEAMPGPVRSPEAFQLRFCPRE
ncbi:cytochrome P450 1A1-like [Actinia tenebrosa]|uniref:Cytochrome P450 1A1-like n=1 Tax=Actinia tenebrosa TaxID=6105 RepID=A0A6P8HPM5_ACTTE|nr:cytochrome P450 1A1-like [Actinia tenebrosa]